MKARFIALVAMFVALSLALGPACKRKQNDGNESSDPSGTSPTSNELPPLELRDDTADLMLTWIDEKGDFHVVRKPADVPEVGKKEVRVVVATKEEGTGKLFYLADLTHKNPDGTYAVKTITRAEWDEKGASRRKARLEALMPPPSASAPAPSASASGGPGPVKVPANKVSAIIYGAEWCKPCHDAARYLRGRGVNVIEKDVDNDETASDEMKKKLERAKLPPTSSIPIIDVMGQVLIGFSPRALDRAVEVAQNAKTL